MKPVIKYILWGVLAILAIFALYVLFIRAKGAPSPILDTLGIKPGKVICDPGNPGYTTQGDFSVQCAKPSPCNPNNPGYDMDGYSTGLCGIPCDESNPGYDNNGNFNILCGGFRTTGNNRFRI